VSDAAEPTAVVTLELGDSMAQHRLHSVVSTGAAMALDLAAHLRELREDEETAPGQRCRDASSSPAPEHDQPTDRGRDGGA
jgi:hypothetical protein